MYSIVDIEATGGNASIGKITEVAIYRFDGEKIIDSFSSLVNPQMKIPIYVQRLTGINDKMAKGAPLFSELADSIFKILKDSIFVAHNVKADYSFIQTAFLASGIEYSSERLCTLELSKELLPEAPAHGLEKVCDYLQIEVENRHRATGDALATVELFKHLLQVDTTNLIQKLKRKAR